MNLKNKNVLVTGGLGFLGNFVRETLSERGASVYSASRATGYDLLSPDEAELSVKHVSPEIIIHLAATVGGIGANKKNPGLFFYNNMMMGMNIIEAAKKLGVPKLVFVGTTCSYPKFTPTPFLEENLWNGYPEETNAPYGVAKRALIVMAQAYREQYGLNAISLLPANLYGPGDNFHPESSHVIPAMIRKFVEAREDNLPQVELWGTGSVSREFLYVKDAAEGIVLATEKYDGSEPVNLGSGKETFIAELASAIKCLVDYKGEIVWNTSQPDGQPRRCLDTTRAKKEFDFESKTPLVEGLKETIKWYLENQ